MIAIASDHGGFALKQEIMDHLDRRRIPYRDFGTYENASCDYPVYARAVTSAVLEGDYEKGILICGTGIGMSIVANRTPGIRCALCSDCYSARLTREHNDANVLALGARVTGTGLALMIVDTFLDTPFSRDPRHERRIQMLED